MLYLVTTDSASIAQIPPQQLSQIIEQQVIPSLEALNKLLAEKKILAGGAVAGQRAHTFIVEAATNDEVTELVQSLPLWPYHNWNVTPLESWEHHTAFIRGVMEKDKAAPQ